MDPDTTYTTAVDPAADPVDRHNAARDLLTWLYGGGFMPAGWAGNRSDLTTMLREIRDKFTPPPPPDRELPPIDLRR